MKERMGIVCVAVVLLAMTSTATHAAIKIASWKIPASLNTSWNDRIPDFRKVIKEMAPDVIAVQGILTFQEAKLILDQALNHKQKKPFRRAPFFDGPDTDSAVFYRRNLLKLISHQQISTAHRDISEYSFRIKKGAHADEEFRLYSLDFKEGSSAADKRLREDQAQTLRDYLNTLPPDSLFVVCGGFNFYSSHEPGFKRLAKRTENNSGRMKDPVDRLGNWHANEEFAEWHTYSTRASLTGEGGLRDRLDMILISYGLVQNRPLTYKLGSYQVFGNDGIHLDRPVNAPENNLVAADTAQALHDASPHLPVTLELSTPGIMLQIKGTISKAVDGTPIENASVDLMQTVGSAARILASVKTSAMGRYFIKFDLREHCREDDLFLNIYAPGYLPAQVLFPDDPHLRLTEDVQTIDASLHPDK